MLNIHAPINNFIWFYNVDKYPHFKYPFSTLIFSLHLEAYLYMYTALVDYLIHTLSE